MYSIPIDIDEASRRAIEAILVNAEIAAGKRVPGHRWSNKAWAARRRAVADNELANRRPEIERIIRKSRKRGLTAVMRSA